MGKQNFKIFKKNIIFFIDNYLNEYMYRTHAGERPWAFKLKFAQSVGWALDRENVLYISERQLWISRSQTRTENKLATKHHMSFEEILCFFFNFLTN